MSVIDIDSLLSAISDDAPCGEDLAYDPAYVELEGMAQGKPEHVMGDEVIPGEEPNWRQVKDRCLELMPRTKDLRVTMYLTVALLKTHNLPGLRDGLELLRGLLDKYWDQLYPALDPEDNNDPTERVNIIDSLATAPHTSGDPMQFRQRLREADLCHSKQMGKFSLRDIMVAKGETKAVGGEAPPTMSGIDGAFMDTDLEGLQANAEAAEEAIEHTKAIESDLTAHLGAGNAPSLGGFVSELDEIKKTLDGYLARRGVGTPASEEASGGEGGVASQDAAPQAISGEIRSREDVIKMLDKACDYYLQHEPSSPVPLLLRRAKRLAAKNFIEIIRDLSPGAMKQIEVFQGVDNAGESG